MDCSASLILLYAASEIMWGGAVVLLSYGRCTRMSISRECPLYHNGRHAVSTLTIRAPEYH